MRIVRRGLAALVGVLTAVATLPGRAAAGAWDLLTDEAARPGVLYLLALVLGFGSFAVYLLRGGGDPTRLELGLQFGSLGVVFYVSLRQAGTAPRRR